MTQKETLAAIRALGLKASYDRETREYRVTLNFGPLPGGRGAQEHMRRREEACASYQVGGADALATARDMAAHWAGLTHEERERVYRPA